MFAGHIDTVILALRSSCEVLLLLPANLQANSSFGPILFPSYSLHTLPGMLMHRPAQGALDFSRLGSSPPGMLSCGHLVLYSDGVLKPIRFLSSMGLVIVLLEILHTARHPQRIKVPEGCNDVTYCFQRRAQEDGKFRGTLTPDKDVVSSAPIHKANLVLICGARRSRSLPRSSTWIRRTGLP